MTDSDLLYIMRHYRYSLRDLVTIVIISSVVLAYIRFWASDAFFPMVSSGWVLGGLIGAISALSFQWKSLHGQRGHLVVAVFAIVSGLSGSLFVRVAWLKGWFES